MTTSTLSVVLLSHSRGAVHFEFPLFPLFPLPVFHVLGGRPEGFPQFPQFALPLFSAVSHPFFRGMAGWGGEELVVHETSSRSWRVEASIYVQHDNSQVLSRMLTKCAPWRERFAAPTLGDAVAEDGPGWPGITRHRLLGK